jgi:hypothetical protein
MIDREKIAHAIWKNITSTNSKVSNVRTLEAFADAGPETREKWLRMAEAVMCVISEPVEEMVEVIKRFRSITNPFPSEDTERYREEFEACEMADRILEPAEKFDKAGYSVSPDLNVQELPTYNGIPPLTPFKEKPVEPWEVPSADREDGVGCLVFHRGKWCHVDWSRQRNCWLYEYGRLGFSSEKNHFPKPFAPLPSHPDVNLNVEL